MLQQYLCLFCMGVTHKQVLFGGVLFCYLCSKLGVSCASAIGKILQHTLQHYLVILVYGFNINSFCYLCLVYCVLVFRVFLILVKPYHMRCNNTLCLFYMAVILLSVFAVGR